MTKADGAKRILEGHQGKVFRVEFSHDGENVTSCSDDGRVIVWEWRTGSILLSYLRHPAAVRSMAFFPDRPDKIVAGRSDGTISIWDLTVRGIVDNILPDPDWLHDGEEQSLVGWEGIEKHHSGAIMAVAISPNGRFMASAATDHTTKLWSVVSYMKDVDVVQADLLDASQKARQLNQYIDVHDEKYDIQIKMKEFVGLRIGEVPIPTGYHSDLVFTFRHDSTVLSVTFNSASDICVTGSMDSTCRLWSCRRGDLLFQINVPAPVSSVFSSPDSDEMYLVCQNRVLIFGYQASAKEEDLPDSWRIHADAYFSGDNTRVRNTPRIPEEDEDDNVDFETLAARKAVMTVADLKQLISHGLVLPSFLDTLLTQFKGVDAEKLFYNMKKVRLLVNSKFHPRDILTALSSTTDSTKLYTNALTLTRPKGNPIGPLMVKLGYKLYDENANADSGIYLHYRDFNPELYGTPLEPPSITGRGGNTPFTSHSQDRRSSYDTDEYRRQKQREMEYYSNKNEKYVGEMYGPVWQRPTVTGDLLHFIPSMQLKLLKDLQGHRDIKPIFLKQVLVDVPKQPNFSPDIKIRDNTPWIPGRGPVSREGVRFNETPIPSVGRRAAGQMPLNNYNQELVRQRTANNRGTAPVPLHGKGETYGTSSKTIFNPNRYLKTMGMNVKWGLPDVGPGDKRGQQQHGAPHHNNSQQGGIRMGQSDMGMISGNSLMIGQRHGTQREPLVNRLGRAGQARRIQGHVYTEPIIIRHGGARGMDFKQQFIVGSGIQVKESTFDPHSLFQGQ
ncbi:UNVERIFIED_CONTAM: Target of rapamycin complex subunit lst8 [Siphonaria sp. JEL0065]|nr:Target of rapamycin complex subunit lst8 [Siphonaria sp. JEL0065]